MLEGQRGGSSRRDPEESVTVVVCAYTRDRWATLQAAVDTARSQSDRDDELLVVVDHNDELLARCREYLDDSSVIPNSHNRGLSGARNTALDQAHGSIIVFLDDDAVPLDGWLDALRAPYADKRVYGVGGLAKPCWLGGQPRWFPEEFLWVVGCSHLGLPSDSHSVRNVFGANMSFRKAAFNHVGGFAEQLGRIGEQPLGCEDTEFAIRLAQANPEAVILYEPASQVEHHVSPRRARLSYFVRRCWGEGISKAEVSRRVGRSQALSAERYYALRVLPRGIWNGLHDSVGGDLWGMARCVSIALGLAATVAGYCVGTFRRSTGGRRKTGSTADS
jgi:glucosyl-dolichyl phosphate glucuronosyltransferase